MPKAVTPSTLKDRETRVLNAVKVIEKTTQAGARFKDILNATDADEGDAEIPKSAIRTHLAQLCAAKKLVPLGAKRGRYYVTNAKVRSPFAPVAQAA